MRKKTCCVTGHRDLPQKEINYVKAALGVIQHPRCSRSFLYSSN